MSGADADGADWRPSALALALVGLYGSFFAIPPAREFFELAPLGLGDLALIAALATAWAVLVMIFWRVRIVDRVRATIHHATH